VLSALRAHPSPTRSWVIDETGLSRSTVAGLIRELIDEGTLAEERAADEPGPGRPAQVLRFTNRAGLVAGLDYGHSHVRVALASTSGVIAAETSVQLDTNASAEAALRTGAGLVDQLLDEAGRRHRDLLQVGVGLPSPVDARLGRVSANNILPSWVDTDPADALNRLLDTPVVVDNDANLGARAELRAAEGAPVNLIYVKASTGIGAGLALDGRIYRSSRGIAGELGHVQVDGAIEVCRCGSRGCLETVASLPRIIRDLRAVHPHLHDVDDLVVLVQAGDPAACRVVSDAGRLIGRTLADVCNVLAPDQVVIGGELSTTGRVFLDAIREQVERHTQPMVTTGLQVRPSTYDGRTEIVGAVDLAIHHIRV